MLNKSNFFTKYQEMLEQHYLQPLDGSTKNNLKNGFIERTIHGAEHASQATLWALIMMRRLQKLTPDYVNASLKAIAEFINVNEEAVVVFILMTMGCHDMARKGEGADIWEKQSAEKALHLLKTLKFEEKHARLFAAAIQYKDDSVAYREELIELGVEKHNINQFDYIRKIVNLGDNLDLMRCVGTFKSEFIFKTLITIKDFNIDLHEDQIMHLITAILQFLYDRHDLQFDCTVKDRRGNDVVHYQSRFSKKEKVKYEHAENVLAVLFAEAVKYSQFEPYLSGFDVPQAQIYTGQVAFDPFLHGTNTSILSSLAKSEFQIMSPLEMMDAYKAVSMTGELTAGGYTVVGSSLIKDGAMGKTSFGIMSAGPNSYTLEKITSNYTNIKIDLTNNVMCFKQQLGSGLSVHFSNINLLLIYFVRARQISDSLEDVLSVQELKLLREQIQTTVQFYSFIQLLGKHIHPNFDAIKRSNLHYNIIGSIFNTYLNFANITEKLIRNKLDMKEILMNPTQENLEKALTLLELPKVCSKIFNPAFKSEEDRYKDIELSTTQFFCLESNYPETVRDTTDPDYAFTALSKNNSLAIGYNINSFLKNFVLGLSSAKFFKKLGECAQQHLIGFNDRIRLFEDLVNTPQEQFKLTELQKYFLHNTFPLILISENEDKIYLHMPSSEEYRSRATLKIGVDIKIIATDTNAHRLEIMKYLELHGITNVQVLLFSDLSKIKITRAKLASPYQHEDGISTLKWLAARQVSTFFKSNDTRRETLEHTNASSVNVVTVQNFIDDAQKYQSINFA